MNTCKECGAPASTELMVPVSLDRGDKVGVVSMGLICKACAKQIALDVRRFQRTERTISSLGGVGQRHVAPFDAIETGQTMPAGALIRSGVCRSCARKGDVVSMRVEAAGLGSSDTKTVCAECLADLAHGVRLFGDGALLLVETETGTFSQVDLRPR